MAATGNEIVKLSQLKWFRDNVVAGMVSHTIAEEASEREKQDGLLEDQIGTKIGTSNIKAGTGISVSQSGNDVTIASTVRDTNTTYTLSKDGSTIKLTGSDGSSTTVTDADTKYTLPAATTSALGGVKVGSGISVSSGTISTSLSNLGVTATAAELNYMDGVTSNVQSQLNGKLSTSGNAASATKATQDSAGQQINTTYVKSVTASGRTVTVTKGDGKTSTFQTQDTTYSNMGGASTSAAGRAGLVPAPSQGNANRYLRSDGTWQVPPDTNTTYSDMKGATSSTAGTHGLVPAPATGANNRYLRSDGTWAVPPDNNTTYGVASTSANGLLRQLNGSTSQYMRGDGTWATPPNTTYSAATTSTAGLLSASDKTKLDGIASGANKTTVDSALSSTSTNPVQNKVINSALAGKAASSHTHPASQVTGLTANRALVSDANGHPAVSAVTSTELGYLDGVTSSIQTQLNGKAASNHTHNYAGSSSAGGAANSAVKLQTARTINGTPFDGTTSITLTAMGAENLDGKSQSLNSLTLSSGSPRVKWYYCPTDGGGSNITGRPSDNAKKAFSLQCELSRYVSSSDFVVKQTYVQHDTHQTWVRYGTGSSSGVSWTAWGRVYTSQDKPTASDIGALASNGNAASATKLQTARTISLTGNVTGSASFNGTANASISATIANNAVTTARIADKAVTPAKMASDPVYIVSSADSTTSISGKTVVKPCILVVTGTNPPQIIYDDGK